MSNDTNISPRQNQLLRHLSQDSLSISQLSKLLKRTKYRTLSKITLLRDLNHLINHGQIIKLGTGKGTHYSAQTPNPLLLPPKKRLTIDSHFNPHLYSHFYNLFTPHELNLINSITPSRKHVLQTIPKNIIKRELERFTIDFAWKSSAIEGNTYSHNEVATLLTTGSPSQKRTTSEAQMILNHNQALQHIWKHPPNPNRYTLDYLQHLHSLLIHNLPIHTGIRSHPVGISGSTYIPLATQSALTNHLTKTLQTINQNSLHPVEQALIAIILISYLQAFYDGNKRLARLMSNAILISHNLLPISYLTTSESDYRHALVMFYEQNTILPFKTIFLKAYQYSATHYFRT